MAPPTLCFCRLDLPGWYIHSDLISPSPRATGPTRGALGVRGVVEAESPLSRTTGEPLFPGLLPSKGGQIEVVVRPQEYVDTTSSR